MLCLFVFDLMWYSLPWSLSSVEQPFARKLNLPSSKLWFSRASEDHRFGVLASAQKIFVLNWVVILMPLRLVRWCMDLTVGADSRNVAVDDLNHADVAAVGHKVPGLSLDTGRVDCVPLHVVPGQLGVWLCLCLLANGLDGRGSIDGFLGAGDVGQPGIESAADMQSSLFRRSLLLFRPVHHLGGGCMVMRVVDKELCMFGLCGWMLCDQMLFSGVRS
jgi:hypothetical protein